MKKLQFESSMFTGGNYNEKDNILTLTFTTGPTYEYRNFTSDDLKKFLAAESKGRHFIRHIKGKYPYTRLGLI